MENNIDVPDATKITLKPINLLCNNANITCKKLTLTVSATFNCNGILDAGLIIINLAKSDTGNVIFNGPVKATKLVSFNKVVFNGPISINKCYILDSLLPSYYKKLKLKSAGSGELDIGQIKFRGSVDCNIISLSQEELTELVGEVSGNEWSGSLNLG